MPRRMGTKMEAQMGTLRDALQQPGLQDKLVDDDDDRIEAEDKAEAIKVAPAEEHHHHRKDHGNDAPKVGDEGHQAANQRPEWSERYAE